jgi:L-lactate dehydrogenase
MVPIWSAAQAGGLPLERFPGWTSSLGDSVFTRTRGSGAEVIKLKGGAGFAVGLSIREVVHAVALDQRRILPVSTLVNGPFGLRDVCISVPTVIGRQGAVAQLEIELWPKEVSALQHSAQVLKETIAAVKKSNPQADGKAKVASEKAAAPAKAAGAGVATAAAKPIRVTTGIGGASGTAGRSRVTISGLGNGRR